jgi:hypothetical protein
MFDQDDGFEVLNQPETNVIFPRRPHRRTLEEVEARVDRQDRWLTELHRRLGEIEARLDKLEHG